MRIASFGVAALLLSPAACMTSRPVSESGNDVVSARFESGWPKWITMPRHGLEDEMIAGVGRSDQADVDVEHAKKEAELNARARLAEELESNIRATMDRTASATSKGNSSHSKIKVLTSEDIRNAVAKRLIGSRVDEYYFMNAEQKEDIAHPKIVHARVIMHVDMKELAQDLGMDENMTTEEKAIFTDTLRATFFPEAKGSGAKSSSTDSTATTAVNKGTPDSAHETAPHETSLSGNARAARRR